MDQDKTDPVQRPQTLLEAAKALVALKGWTEQFNEMRRLCAAIAREEAMPGESAAYWEALCDTRKVAMEKAMDRAQQAEASAAWHKAESERLSEDLRTARELLAYSKCAWQERAEKAEAAYSDRDRQYCALRTESARWQDRAEEAEAALSKGQHAFVGVRSDLKSFAHTSVDALNMLLKALGGKS